MEYNKSLSARIKRRNKQGFAGKGTGLGFIVNDPGDYRDEKQNHKDIDRRNDIAHKNKVGFRKSIVRSRVMSKKYSDNHQKMS